MQDVHKEAYPAGLEIVLRDKFADEVKHNLYPLYPVPAGFIRGMDDDFLTNSLTIVSVNSVIPTCCLTICRN
jgi:hypothetical protein